MTEPKESKWLAEFVRDMNPSDRTLATPVSWKALVVLMEKVRGLIDRKAGEREALEARIAELEKKLASVPKYLGVHQAGRHYSPGSMCTRHGSIWHANVPTTATPGEGPDWTLCVKAGRDLRPSANERSTR